VFAQLLRGYALIIRIQQALKQPDTQIRLFGKPEVKGQRRMGVALARDNSVDAARQKALDVSATITTEL